MARFPDGDGIQLIRQQLRQFDAAVEGGEQVGFIAAEQGDGFAHARMEHQGLRVGFKDDLGPSVWRMVHVFGGCCEMLYLNLHAYEKCMAVPFERFVPCETFRALWGKPKRFIMTALLG